jgi:streptogrisin C
MGASMVNLLLKRLLVRAAAALLVGAALAGPAAAQPVLQTSAEALEQDAREFASQSGLDLEEALGRLRFQEESVAATDRLRALHAKRLAGLLIEHRPDHRVVVLLTGRKKVPNETLVAGGRSVPVVFRTGAKATQAQVVAAIRRHQAEIRSTLDRPPGMGADPRTGELVILVNRKDAEWHGADELDARFEALTRVPVRIRVMDGEEADLGLEGGARVDGLVAETGRRQYCTSGFVVTDGTRTGLVTAAHCPDSLTYRDPRGGAIPLTFLGQWGWSFQDVQLHLGEAEHSPLFYADADKKVARTITGARGRASTRVGDIVCRRGETSGYGCSEVELVDYAPPGDLCGGPCAPTWVTVKGACRGGDSGGPVFTGTVALGIVKGGGTHSRSGKCDYWFYMPVDFMPDGWSVLTETGPAILPQRLAERSTSRRAK